MVYEGATVEECSLNCVTADGFNCRSFDFCPSSKKCLLNSGYSNSPLSKNTTTELCYNYKRNIIKPIRIEFCQFDFLLIILGDYFFVTDANKNKLKQDENDHSESKQISFYFSVIFLNKSLNLV
jgi:hypothetical protein